MPISAEIAAIYARNSKLRGARSVSEQKDIATGVCRENRWRVHGVYEDKRSASRFEARDRKDWLRLLADLERQAFTVLVLWETSRGDRKLTGWATLLDQCRDRRIKIHVINHHRTYEPWVSRDWRTLAEDGVDSHYESEKLSERVLRDSLIAAGNGRPWGTVPYGYQRIYDPHTRQLIAQVELPEEAEIVREIMRRVGAREAVQVVADDLNARGILSPNGGAWRRSTVRVIALNPVYIGKRVHKRNLHDGQWDGLVTEREFRKVVAHLTDPARLTTRPGSQKYLLSYLALCGVCGSDLSGRDHAASRPLPFYKCSASSCVVCPMDALDTYIRDVITGLHAAGDGVFAVGGDELAAQAAVDEAERHKESIKRHILMSGRGDITETELGIVLADLRPRIAEAEVRALRLSAPAPPFNPATGWDAPVPMQKLVVRGFLGRFDGKIQVFRADRPGRRRAGEAMDYSRVLISGERNGEPVIIRAAPGDRARYLQ